MLSNWLTLLKIPMLKFLMHNRVSPSAAVLILFLMLLVCTTDVVAQKDSASAPASQKAKPTVAAIDKARARRVSPPAAPASEKVVAAEETAPESSTTQTEGVNRSLRAQIAAATTPAGKALLKMRLVDQLAAAGLKREAIAELQTMVAEDRFDPTGFYNMGNRLVHLGDDETAVRAYRKAIDQRKGSYSRALNNLGAVLLKQGRWDEAYESLSSALRHENFNYAEASFNLGRLYAARGETDLAMREWQRILATNPGHAGAARALATVRTEGRIWVGVDTKSRPATLADARQRTATRNSGPLTVDQPTYHLLQQARNARERGHNEEAIRYYRDVLSHTGGYFAPANLELSYAMINLKRPEEAIALLVPVSMNEGARYPICYYHLARLYEAQGQLRPAEENYSRAAAAYSGENSQFILDLSRVREKLGDLPGALAALEQFVHAEEKTGLKSLWAEERLVKLRQRIAVSAAAPAKP